MAKVLTQMSVHAILVHCATTNPSHGVGAANQRRKVSIEKFDFLLIKSACSLTKESQGL
jgi:hypothetical protein